MSHFASYHVHTLNNQPLSEKEFEIINIIADGFRSNQRELSTHIGISLGMTNLLLRRLVTKGYLRIKQLDAKKVQYLLTPQGLSEKAKKSLLYTRKTVQSFGIIKEEIRRLLRTSLNQRIKEIYVIGQGDLAELVSMILRDSITSGQYTVKQTVMLPDSESATTFILDASHEPHLLPNDTTNYINIMTCLSEALSFRNDSPASKTINL